MQQKNMNFAIRVKVNGSIFVEERGNDGRLARENARDERCRRLWREERKLDEENGRKVAIRLLWHKKKKER